jgi:hypothetical protein
MIITKWVKIHISIDAVRQQIINNYFDYYVNVLKPQFIFEDAKQEREEYTNKQSETNYQNMNDNHNTPNQQDTNTGVRFEEDVLNCPSANKYPKKCTSRSDYLKQALIFHPDKNHGCTGNATEKFKVLQTICKGNTGGKRMRKTNKKRTRKNKRKFMK